MLRHTQSAAQPHPAVSLIVSPSSDRTSGFNPSHHGLTTPRVAEREASRHRQRRQQAHVGTQARSTQARRHADTRHTTTLPPSLRPHPVTMSIIQQHTSASLSDAWRTINIDALEEDSCLNFDTSTLHPPLPETSEAEVRQLAGQVRQLLRGGDSEGALRGSLETPVYNGSEAAKVTTRV